MKKSAGIRIESMNRRQFLGGVTGSVIAEGFSNAEACSCLPGGSASSSLSTPPGKIKITDVKTLAMTPSPTSDRPYVFVRIETNAGLYGLGEATLEGKAGSILAAVSDYKEYLVGQDPTPIEHLWQSMYVGSFFRAGIGLCSAISGIDQALWDLLGKIYGLPVYRLLGAPRRPRIRAYLGYDGKTDDELQERMEAVRRAGVTAVKTGLPGETYELIETNKEIDRTVNYLAKVRELAGEQIDVAVDFHAKTSPAVAVIIAKEVEPLHLLWTEEPCAPENVDAMARIARRTTTPLATGERLVTLYGFRRLVEENIVDVLQPDINHCGGISAMLKISTLAEAAGLSMAPHNCTGPVGSMAVIQTDAAMPTLLCQENCLKGNPEMERMLDDVLADPVLEIKDGYYEPPEKPGLGIELNESALKKYPFTGTKLMALVYHEDDSVAAW